MCKVRCHSVASLGSKAFNKLHNLMFYEYIDSCHILNFAKCPSLVVTFSMV